MDKTTGWVQDRPMGIPSGFTGEIHLTLSQEQVRRAALNPELRSCYATDLGMYPRAQGHFRRRSQGSPQTIVILCLEGRGTVTMGHQGPRPVGPGEFFCIPPGLPHEYGAREGDPWTIQWAHVVAPRLPEDPVFPRRVDPGVLERLRAHFADVAALVSQSGLTAASMDGLRWWLSLLLEAPPLAPLPGVLDTDPVRAVTAAMNDHLTSPLTLAALASHAGLSPSRFSAVFRQRHGIAPMAYYRRLRLQKACALLAQTTLSVARVARAVGFDDPLHFSRAFRRCFGAPPGLWRRGVGG